MKEDQPYQQTTPKRPKTDFSAFGNNYAQLLLSMFLSHSLLGTPFYGAAIYLLGDCWTVYFSSGAHHVRTHSGVRNMLLFTILITIIAGISLIHGYPRVMRHPYTTPLLFYVGLLLLRNGLSVFVGDRLRQRGGWGVALRILFQIVCLLPCLWLERYLAGEELVMAWAGFLITGVMLLFRPAGVIHRRDLRGLERLNDIRSYEIFSSTGFNAQTAFSLGVFMYMCYICLAPEGSTVLRYLLVAAWLLTVVCIFRLFRTLQGKIRFAGGFNTFMVGAAMWIAGSIVLFSTVNLLESALWLIVWGMGIAATNAVLINFEDTFSAIAALDGRTVNQRELKTRSNVAHGIAYLFSASLMIIVLTIWCFVIPATEEPTTSTIFRRTMMFLPLFFIAMSLFFALRQPLDVAQREKLHHYIDAEIKNPQMRDNLKNMLVRKYRTRFGIKLLMLALRPLLHLKLYGREKIDPTHFPSIFVCNHGIIYGPISAVIYLPTYFRPWIDRKMLNRSEAAEEMYRRFLFRIPLLTTRAKKRVARALARPVVWGLNSCNPIPVERDNLRNVMSTFGLTVEALKEGDNVLLFPERPHTTKIGDRETVVHETETVGAMFTGFANLGKIYYEATGKALRFYPLYTNKRSHTLRIGDPVIFDPTAPHKEEKQRIASTLRARMLSLKQEE